MKKFFYLCMITLLALILTSCATGDAPGVSENNRNNRIMSVGPAITEILVDLGLGERIIAADNFSAFIPGVPSNLEFVLDMWVPDMEAILALAPDTLLFTDMFNLDGVVLELLVQSGTHVVRVPQHNNIAGIIENIHFIAREMDVLPAGEELTQSMMAEIEQVRTISANISNKRTVYFEIDPTPFTFGQGSFMQEILEIIGAVNIFADSIPWTVIADEQILAHNPDVILTNVGWMDNAVNELKSRPGWDSLYAVINNRVYLIDENTTSRDNHNIVQAMWQIARAVYPEYFD
ncbi:MAG: ABC transporter substrate-binding protein [Firmicutes bacterium]|nr:ABC transporter substrate-binding protein [Bacillota bacterium]